MIGLICFVLAVLASPFKSKSRLEAENAALRHQLIVSIEKALAGSYRAEHLFALEQALALYGHVPAEGICLRHPDRGRIEGTQHPSWSRSRSIAVTTSA